MAHSGQVASSENNSNSSSTMRAGPLIALVLVTAMVSHAVETDILLKEHAKGDARMRCSN